ncbi:hypothetical protein AAV94_07500 [Lampropedia cohaerens]|uniref:Protoporphyrinogen IX dehydrogenase [quinone] n=1 Tax=Lampropedia cohaerens TaxID=1610491 RepID=A0A0U1PZQ7_9BURK|nr:menaquinone-dependent protoporphyrinogen IX dehydrogenase [Lampropedia cohaerens]KKW68003.1 hypothetical protein AAV94_07500 [Lampropedia cohaerens]
MASYRAERIAILHSSVDGFTQSVCERLQAQFARHGHRTLLLPIDDALQRLAAQDLQRFDRMLIGASIRYGRHRHSVQSFITRHQALLQSRPGALFSVNLVARKPGKDTPDGNPYMRKLLRDIAWKPDLAAVFAGCLDYARYGPFDRQMIRLIMWLTGGPTHSAQPIVFTDWQRVHAFGEAFLTLPAKDRA